MAVNKVPQTSRIIITIKDGMNAKGQSVLRKRVYKNVKAKAADADVFAVAQGMANLQTHAVENIIRQDEGTLVSE